MNEDLFTTSDIKDYLSDSDIPESYIVRRIIIDLSRRIDTLERELDIAKKIIEINRQGCRQGF